MEIYVCDSYLIDNARLGYRNENLDRRQVIDILFDNLRSKANIHTSRSVVNIDTLSDGVKVETADGSVFEGDIVIGADGIHSRVLKEMQRQAEIDTPGSNQFSTDCKQCFLYSILLRTH